MDYNLDLKERVMRTLEDGNPLFTIGGNEVSLEDRTHLLNLAFQPLLGNITVEDLSCSELFEKYVTAMNLVVEKTSSSSETLRKHTMMIQHKYNLHTAVGLYMSGVTPNSTEDIARGVGMLFDRVAEETNTTVEMLTKRLVFIV